MTKIENFNLLYRSALLIILVLNLKSLQLVSCGYLSTRWQVQTFFNTGKPLGTQVYNLKDITKKDKNSRSPVYNCNRIKNRKDGDPTYFQNTSFIYNRYSLRSELTDSNSIQLCSKSESINSERREY